MSREETHLLAQEKVKGFIENMSPKDALYVVDTTVIHLANYAVKAGVVCLHLQVKLCDPHLSALEVRFS